MPIRDDIKAIAGAVLDTEALKDADETGYGIAIDYIRNGLGDIIAHKITVQTSGGLKLTFPQIPARREPTEEETQAIVKDYGKDLVAEIKARRATRKSE